MARQSTLKPMRTVSALLLLAVASLIAAGIVKLRHDHVLSGSELIGWAIVPLALTLGFTWPVRCRAKTTKRKACGNWAYGFLLGCPKTPGHWTGKFLAQLGSKRGGEAEPAGRRRSSENTSVFNQAAPQSQPIKVTVEEGALAKFGFWIGFISGIVGVIQTIISLVH
jgi:hypothetical protein